jgi:hypothetical protein
MSVRSWFWLISVIVSATIGLLSLMWQPVVIAYLFVVPLVSIGIYDQFQTKHAVLRNFPVIGHGRYMLEAIRPEINQYFIESDTDGEPFDRLQRSVVYQRAKGVNDTTPFGTQLDVYLPGYEWLEHSLRAKHPSDEHPRVTIGGRNGGTPYSASVLNISAISRVNLAAGRMPPWPGLAPWLSLISIILTCASVARSTNGSAAKPPVLERQPK